MELELQRRYYPQGTNGTLACNGLTICATIELPWKNNGTRISCIPEGRYSLIKRYSPHLKDHLMLKDVPDRQYILIHPANNALLELEGCIAPVSLITGIGQGIQSVPAMKKIISILAHAFDSEQPVFIIIKKEIV